MLSVRSRKIMNHIYRAFARAFAVLGIMTSLGKLPHAVNAQVATKLIAQVSAANFYNQGLDKARRGDYQGAIASLNEAIQLNPNYTEAYKYRVHARATSEFNDPQGAIADFNQAIRLAPNDADAYADRGKARLMLGDVPGQMADIQKAKEIERQQANPQRNQDLWHKIRELQQ